MKVTGYLRLLHRAWRYRLHTERAEIRFMLDTIRPGQCVVDIGAHKAAFTYWMARLVGPNGSVLAFEPQPNLAEYLRDVAAEIGRETVRICDCALSDKEGEAHLFFRGEHAGAASLEVQHGESIAVPVRTLDDVIREAQLPAPVSFIKCDVEEHELAVFRGAQEILANDKPILLFESDNIETGQDRLTPIIDLLGGLDYAGYFFEGTTLHPFADFSPGRFHFAHLAQQNYVFLPADRLTLERNRPTYQVVAARRDVA
jgi:FkbM family methyltransferase